MERQVAGTEPRAGASGARLRVAAALAAAAAVAVVLVLARGAEGERPRWVGVVGVEAESVLLRSPVHSTTWTLTLARREPPAR